MVKLTQTMFHVTILLATLLDTQNTAVGGPARQYFISTPQNTTVTAGHHARLSCTVGNIVGTCQWTRDGFALGTDRNLEMYSRYLMAGERADICDLSIDPVLPLDEGEYQCQVSGGHGVAPISSAPVTLSVNSEPGHPYILQAKEDEMMEVQNGEEVELECQSQGGRPPAEIQWWDGEGRRIVSHVKEHVMRMEDKKTFKTVSTLKFKPSSGQQIKCSAHNDAFPAGKVSQPFLIEFKGQPKVEVELLEDGDSVKIFCNSEQISRNRRFKWFINDVEIFDETQNVLEIQQFSKSYDKSKVKCSVKDKNGEDEVVRVVELVHIPKKGREPKALPKKLEEFLNTKSSSIRNNQKKEKNDNKKKTTFTCIVEEDVTAEPKYVWLDGKLREMAPDEAIDASHQKRKYKCKVIPKGMKKMNRMSKDMKQISKTLKKFSKTLTVMTSPIDYT